TPYDTQEAFSATYTWLGLTRQGSGNSHPAPTPPPLSAVGFLRAVMIPMCLPACVSLSLLLSTASRGLGQRPHPQGGGLLLRLRHRWPGFRDEAAQRQRGLVKQCHQNEVPPPAKDTHQPQAGGTLHPRRRGDQRRDVWDRAGRDRRVRLAPDAEQPQGRHG